MIEVGAVEDQRCDAGAPPVAGAVRREVLQTAAVGLLVAGVAALGLLIRKDLFWQDDMLNQYLPATRDVARAIFAGEWPLLASSCWSGASLAGEYQPAIFSLFEVALSTMVWSFGPSVWGAAAVLVLCHLAILGAGAFRLARLRDVPPGAAVLVALVTSLNGFIGSWAAVTWYPALTSFTWLPWAWWALEQALRERTRRPWRFALAGAFVYAILSAGWPFTCAMIALVTAWLAARVVLGERRIVALWPLVASWLVGLGLAAPALATLVEHVAQSPRGTAEGALNLPMMVPFEGFFGAAVPSYQTYWHNLFVWAPRRSLEVAGALVPMVLFGDLLLRHGRRVLREYLPELLLLGLVTLLATSPSPGSFRFSFRWLPLWHLVLALLGGAALARAPAGGSRLRAAAPAVMALGLTALTLLRALLIGFDATPTTKVLGAWLLALACGWVAMSFLTGPRGRVLSALAFTLGSLALTYHQVPPNSEVPEWKIAPKPQDAAPLSPGVRYLGLYEWFDLMTAVPPEVARSGLAMMTGGLRPGYTAMYAGVEVLHGYTGMGHAGLSSLFRFGIQGEVPEGMVQHILSQAAAGGGLLRLTAVDGLIVHERHAAQLASLETRGWQRHALVPSAIVLHRATGPTPRAHSVEHAFVEPSREAALARVHATPPVIEPIVLIASPTQKLGPQHFAIARVELLREERLRSVARVEVPRGGRPALVVFARPWVQGWSATLDGVPLPVQETSALVPGVVVPPGARGEVVLSFLPPVLPRALTVALLTLLTAAGAAASLALRRGSRDLPPRT